MSVFHHIPVLAEGVLEHLTFPAGRKVRMIDGTLGGGGHSSMLLEKYPQLELLGIDRDEMALENAAKKLAFAGERIHLLHGEYAAMKELALSVGWEKVDGILLDSRNIDLIIGIAQLTGDHNLHTNIILKTQRRILQKNKIAGLHGGRPVGQITAASGRQIAGICNGNRIGCRFEACF